MTKIQTVLSIVLGAVGAGVAISHGYILGVVADRPESDGAFQGVELETLTLTAILGVLAGVALVVIGVVSLLIARNNRPS